MKRRKETSQKYFVKAILSSLLYAVPRLPYKLMPKLLKRMKYWTIELVKAFMPTPVGPLDVNG